VIGSVDKDNADGRSTKRLGGGESSEPSADNNDLRLRHGPDEADPGGVRFCIQRHAESMMV
jgi:hypothetical protein